MFHTHDSQDDFEEEGQDSGDSVAQSLRTRLQVSVDVPAAQTEGPPWLCKLAQAQIQSANPNPEAFDFVLPEGIHIGVPWFFSHADPGRIPSVEALEGLWKPFSFPSKASAWNWWLYMTTSWDGRSHWVDTPRTLAEPHLVDRLAEEEARYASSTERYKALVLSLQNPDPSVPVPEWNGPGVNLGLVIKHMEASHYLALALRQCGKITPKQEELF